MTAKNLRGLEMLVRLFTHMVYLGAVVVGVGVALGSFLSGAAEAVVISACVGVGGMILYAGLRGKKRGKASLARLRGEASRG